MNLPRGLKKTLNTHFKNVFPDTVENQHITTIYMEIRIEINDLFLYAVGPQILAQYNLTFM